MRKRKRRKEESGRESGIKPKLVTLFFVYEIYELILNILSYTTAH